jgi:hypothetical protein
MFNVFKNMAYRKSWPSGSISVQLLPSDNSNILITTVTTACPMHVLRDMKIGASIPLGRHTRLHHFSYIALDCITCFGNSLIDIIRVKVKVRCQMPSFSAKLEYIDKLYYI